MSQEIVEIAVSLGGPPAETRAVALLDHAYTAHVQNLDLSSLVLVERELAHARE
jgi:hypothetical protein